LRDNAVPCMRLMRCSLPACPPPRGAARGALRPHRTCPLGGGTAARGKRARLSTPLPSVLEYGYYIRMPGQRRERQRTVGKRQRVKATERAPMKITTIALDEEMHAALRHLAVDEKTNLRELLRHIIADYLARRGRR